MLPRRQQGTTRGHQGPPGATKRHQAEEAPVNEPRYTVEPVTQLALFQLGYRFLVVGPRRECWGLDRTAEEAHLAAGRAEQPAALVQMIQASGLSG
jgi:hypothetical protein